MADITSAQTGNWSSGTTWVGGVAPGDGDTATIANTHTVTIDQDVTVGTAPDGDTAVVIVNLTGHLTLGAGRTLNLKGRLGTGNGNFIAEAGSTINVIVGEGLTYSLYFGVYSTGTPTTAVYFNGSSNSNRCTVKKTGLGTVKIEHYVSTDSGPFVATYTDFIDLGAVAVYCARLRRSLEITNSRFINCGELYIGGTTIDADQNLDLGYNNFSGSLGTNSVNLITASVPDAGKVRRIRFNVFDKVALLYNMREVDITDNVFLADFNMPTATYSPKSWERNFLVKSTDLTPKVEVLKDCFLYWPIADNIHFGVWNKTQTFDGFVVECAQDWGVENNENDFALIEPAATPPAGTIVTVKNCINLPIDGYLGKSSSTIFTSDGHTGVVYRVSNNTFCAGQQGAGLLADDHDGDAGSIEYFKNNIGWAGPGALRAELLQSDHNPPESITDDYITMADYNGRWGLTATAYEDVSANAFASTPGTHDLSADPMFVDRTRNLANYSNKVLGYTGNNATLRSALLRALGSINNPDSADYEATLSVMSIIQWIRDGFAPTNPLYKTASDTGSYIGAVEPVTLNTASGFLMMVF